MPVELPDGFSQRPPTMDDAAEVAALIHASQLADFGESDMTVEALLDDWQGMDLEEEATLIVAPNGAIAACADILNRSFVLVSVYGYVHPAYRGQGLGRALVEWGERWTLERIDRAPEDARVVVRQYVNTRNEAGLRLLEGAGYEAVRTTYVMGIELDDQPPAPVFPEGLRVRTFVPGQDERATFEVAEDTFRDHWGRPPGTFERFLNMTRESSWDPELWFLVEDDEGIQALCLSKIVAGEGEVDVVGVRRPWRRRGVGLALLHLAFGAFYERGVRKIGLNVDAESATGAPRVYGRAGMKVTQSYTLFEKELRSGRDLAVQT